MPIQFYGQPGKQAVLPKRPVRILFLTSIRDVVGDDRNGQLVSTPQGLNYLMGVVEYTIWQTRNKTVGNLYQVAEVAGIVTDDTKKDAHRYNISPLPGQGRWIVPDSVDLGVPVFNIPSEFRLLPLIDKAHRRKAKQKFEAEVIELMARLGIDVLISDHYMARLEFMFPPVLQFGRVLNIHPAPTVEDHMFCFKGKTPTADAISMAKKNGLQVYTGATLHVVDPEIDHGPVVAFATDTPVFASDEPMWLRHRNYQQSKLPVFVAGLRHYITRIYPYLNELDLTKLVPV